jgi:hypothetical protein
VDVGAIELGVMDGFNWLRIGTSGGLFLHGNKLPSYIKFGTFIDLARS